MKRYIRKAINSITKGRGVQVRKDDLFIVSYPKSGNTWMRFLLGNIVHEDFNFINMEELVPDIYANINYKIDKLNSPRILKSHECFDPRYNKIIYIVRDPRSVAVSYFEYLKKFGRINEDLNFSEYLRLFLIGEYDTFGSWDENFKSWFYTKGGSSCFLLIKYEDLKFDTFTSMKQVIDFLEWDISDNDIKNAITKSSFENMRSNEIKNRGKVKVFKGSNENKPFVRKGSINEWIEYFNDEDLELLNSKYGATMKLLGYE